MVKKAGALANLELGTLSPKIADAIMAACDQIIAGEGHEFFVVDMLQGGAGTSTNMNANEVIANMALRHIGKPRGDYAESIPMTTSISRNPPMTFIPRRCALPFCAIAPHCSTARSR